MNKSILFSSLMLAAAIASATTITSDCPVMGGSGIPSSNVTSSCPSFALPGGPVTYDSITLIYKYDADFGLGTGSIQMTHDVLGATLGTLFDNSVPTTVTDVTRPFQASITQPGSLALAQAIAAGTSIMGSWGAGTGSIARVAFDYQWQVNYTSATPEPATLGLMGLAMVGLGVFRRRRI